MPLRYTAHDQDAQVPQATHGGNGPQNIGAYITARSGRRLAYAAMVSDVVAIADIERDVAGVIEDEAQVANAVFKGGR